MKKARAKKKVKATHAPPKPRKRKRPARLSLPKVLAAIEGSGGIKSEVTRRLGCAYNTLDRFLRAHPVALEALAVAGEQLADAAEATIKEAIDQRDDLRLAAKTSQWYLERRRAGQFGDRRQLTLEGGPNPIQVRSASVPVEDLPLDLRLKLLNAIEENPAAASD